MNDRKRPAFLVRRGSEFEVMFAYDPDVVEELKDEIHFRERHWNASRRTWLVNDDAIGNLAEILESHGYEVEFLVNPEKVKPQRTSPTLSPDHAALNLTADAPWELVDAAYRSLAKLYHPDVSGNETTERMKTINIAYERLQKLRTR